jgi:hypothetical protein
LNIQILYPFLKLNVIVAPYLEPKLSDFLLDLRRSLPHKGFAKILDISTGMPAVFANLYASRSQYISSPKIAQLRLKQKRRNSIVLHNLSYAFTFFPLN